MGGSGEDFVEGSGSQPALQEKIRIRMTKRNRRRPS
jgi:hypothetical protein